MSEQITRDDVRSAVNTIRAIAETIREVGEVPSGTLYAGLAGRLDLPAFERCIRILVDAGVVHERGHVLTWIGPAAEAAQ